MNIWTNYWTKAQDVATEHLDQYTQLPPSEKQNVQVRTFAVAAGVGLLGACFSPKIAPIIGVVAGLATFAYLTRKEEKASPPSPLPAEITKPPQVQVTLRNSRSTFNPSSLVDTLSSYPNYSPINRALIPIAGIGLSPFLYPHYFKPQGVLPLPSSSNSYEDSFTIGPSTLRTPADNPPETTSSSSEANNPPETTSSPSDMEFELNVYKMENSSLKAQVEELERKLQQSRAASQTSKNEEVLEEDTLLTKESLQQGQGDKDRLASIQEQWETDRDNLEQTVEKQKIQIAHLNFKLQTLKKQPTNDLSKQQSANPELARRPIKSSNSPLRHQLNEVTERLGNLEEAYHELAEDYQKIQKKNNQQAQALTQKIEQEEKDKALIRSYENDLDMLLREREKLRGKLLKIKGKEERLREEKLREARQQMVSQKQELIQLRQELEDLKEKYQFLTRHPLPLNSLENAALGIIMNE